MLAKVFLPRTHDKYLGVTIRSFEILEYSPSGCSVPPPNTSVFVHRFYEFLGLFGDHVVFDYHENWTF